MWHTQDWFIPVVANTGAYIGLSIGCLVIGAVGMKVLSNLMGTKTLADAKKEADGILVKAKEEGQTLTKQLELDSRNEMAQRRESFEKEITEERNQVKDAERRLAKREDNLDRKLDVLATKEKTLTEYDQKIQKREQRAQEDEKKYEQLLSDQKKVLEQTREEAKQALLRMTNLNEEEARREALHLVEQEVQHEAGQIIKRKYEIAEEEARENALKITLQAIQRYASDHTASSTVSAVDIPSDDMKGRVIGREGRNIRAFEKATGVDVIVDDTPGVVVVSCFDPVRRTVAAESLKSLIDDGRIHPTRIEEVVKQTEEEVQQRIVKLGKEACIEADIQGLNPKIIEMMGRLHFRTSYGQNILRHSVEVAFLCQVIADELGLDGALARRCGFLHDIGKAMDHDTEGGHPQIGMDFCRKHGEGEAVLNAVGGHHNDIPSTTHYTPIVMAADAISGARPGARRETLERYIKRLQELESIATNKKGVRGAYAIQAGREVRVIVDPDTVGDSECHQIARAIANEVSEQMTFPGEIQITVLREMRTVEYAK